MFDKGSVKLTIGWMTEIDMSALLDILHEFSVKNVLKKLLELLISLKFL